MPDAGPHGNEDPDVTLEEIADDVGVSVEFIRSLVTPERECLDCGHVWRYSGDADRPTCPNCKGKRTELADVDDA